MTAGFTMGDATRAAAERNPQQKFSIADFTYDPPIPNVATQVFDTNQASFMAGYLAAGVTRSGKVGIFGGMQIPPVVAFMDGFALGAQYYARTHGKNILVLGWYPSSQSGKFIGNFSDVDAARQTTNQMIAAGVDIIMPVAGGAGIGAGLVAKEHHGVYIIGVDTDWYQSSPEIKDVILTSVMKRIDTMTFNIIKATLEGSFRGGEMSGNLGNDGVGLAPFHDLESLVSPELRLELEEIRSQIVSGAIQTRP